MLVAFAVAGCIPAGERANESATRPTSSATAAAPSIEPTTAPTPTAPAATATAAPTEAPTPTPTVPDETPVPSPPGNTGSAACTGSDDNRAFFAAVANDVDWPVYCPSLPARWSVDSGQYRLAGGGWMRIAYKGPGGARFELSEGAFCDQADGCVPPGTDAGSAAFGNLSGTLVTGNDGRLAIVVDRGANRSWLAVGVGLDLEAFKGYAADLVLVD